LTDEKFSPHIAVNAVRLGPETQALPLTALAGAIAYGLLVAGSAADETEVRALVASENPCVTIFLRLAE
jgi:hypothetical protein